MKILRKLIFINEIGKLQIKDFAWIDTLPLGDRG
jgi:hypothetical protein